MTGRSALGLLLQQNPIGDGRSRTCYWTGGIYVGRRTSFAVTLPTVGIVPKVRRAFARAFQPLALSFMEEKKKYVSPFGTGKKRMKRFFKS